MEPNIPQQNPAPGQTAPTKSSGIGPLIAIVVILLLIIAGGLYFWISRESSPVITPDEVSQEDTDQFEDVSAELHTNEFSEIEADLNSIDEEF